MLFQELERSRIRRVAAALVDDLTLPLETECVERREYLVARARHFTCWIDVLDADQPAAPVNPGVEVTRHGGEDRAGVQGPGRRGSESSAVASLCHVRSTRVERAVGVRAGVWFPRPPAAGR